MESKTNEGVVIEGETEDRARRMGWVPQEEFRGADDRWVTAEKFLERGENELPIMRERMKKQDKTILGLNKTISGMSATFGEFQKHQQGVADRAYKKGMADVEAKKLDAVERNDVDAYKAAVKEGEDLKPEEVPTTPVADPQADAENEEFDEWRGENKWFDDNPKLQKYASQISGPIQEQTGLGGKALYDKVGEQVAAMYPDAFENKNRNAPTTVVGDGGNPPPVGKRNYAALPPEAKTMCDKFVKEIPGYTKEQYVDDYEWD